MLNTFGIILVLGETLVWILVNARTSINSEFDRWFIVQKCFTTLTVVLFSCLLIKNLVYPVPGHATTPQKKLHHVLPNLFLGLCAMVRSLLFSSVCSLALVSTFFPSACLFVFSGGFGIDVSIRSLWQSVAATTAMLRSTATLPKPVLILKVS
jgi:hypothetical protein